jgi:histidinol dehydrogenase
VLVTDSTELAEKVQAEASRLAQETKHAARVAEALAGPQSAIVLVDDLDAAAAFSNVYGAEHLEIQTADAERMLGLIENAGAIFLGDSSPVSLGDYLAGSNHVLPTGGQARFAAGLGAYTFLRSQQIIRYDRQALGVVERRIVALANAEDLPAHAAAISARFRDR